MWLRKERLLNKADRFIEQTQFKPKYLKFRLIQTILRGQLPEASSQLPAAFKNLLKRCMKVFFLQFATVPFIPYFRKNQQFALNNDE